MLSNDRTLNEFGYDRCTRCNGDHLAFSLADGVCYWCRGVLTREGGR